jgi:hypothetical protein
MQAVSHPVHATRLAYSARTLTALCALFWIWFGVASGIAEGLSPAGVVFHTAPGVFLAAMLAVAWRWEGLGGTLLIASGLLIALLYGAMAIGRLPLGTVVFVLLTMAAPPLAAGALFLLDSERFKSR